MSLSDTLTVVAVAHTQMPWLIGAVSHRFEVTALALSGLLVLGALLSGLARRTFVSLTAGFVIAGFILGDGVTGALHFDPRSGFVSELATVALIVILLRDGLEVDGELLQSHWRLPFRKLVLAMPLTAVIVAAGTKLLTGLSWTESLVRPQGRGHDDLLAARARPGDRRWIDDLQSGRAHRVLLDPRPRRDRHGGSGVAGEARRGGGTG